MRKIGKWLLIGFVALIVIAVIASMGANEDETADASQTAAPSAEASLAGAPSAEPTSEPSQAPTPTPAPTPGFADIALSGSGDSVPLFEIPEGTAAIAEAAHTGTGNFAILTVYEDGTTGDLLVNAIGNYSGTVLFDEQDGQHSVGFQVTADGPWTITIRPVTSAQAWDAGSAVSGVGDSVVRIEPAVSDLLTVNVSHTGVGNFAIIGYGGGAFGSELLVNEIGAYDGEVLIAPNTFLLEISADGDWSITPS